MNNFIHNPAGDKQLFLVRGEIADFITKQKKDSEGDQVPVSVADVMGNKASRPTVRFNSHTIRFQNLSDCLGDKEWKLFDGILILLAQFTEDQGNVAGVDIPVPLLKKFVGYRKLDDLQKHLEGLKSTKVQYLYFDRYQKLNTPEFGPMPLILDYSFAKNNKILNVSFAPDVAKDLFGEERYVFLDYVALKAFKTRYARLLYKNLMQDDQELKKSKLSGRLYKLDDLKSLLDWPKKSWHKNHEFKTKIEDSIADINENSDLYIWQYEFHQKGKELTAVEFTSFLDLTRRHDSEKQISGVESHNKDNIGRDAIYNVTKLLKVPMHKGIFPSLFATWQQAKREGQIDALYGEVYSRNRHKAFELFFENEYKIYAADKAGILKPIFEAAGKLVNVKYENSGSVKKEQFEKEKQKILKGKPAGMADSDFLRLNGWNE